MVGIRSQIQAAMSVHCRPVAWVLPTGLSLLGTKWAVEMLKEMSNWTRLVSLQYEHLLSPLRGEATNQSTNRAQMFPMEEVVGVITTRGFLIVLSSLFILLQAFSVFIGKDGVLTQKQKF